MNVYIVSELCTGDDLFERFMNTPSFDEHTVATLIKQMVEALNYCWKEDNHRQVLRPESFRFASKEDETLKLVDLGISQLFEDQGNSHS